MDDRKKNEIKEDVKILKYDIKIYGEQAIWNKIEKVKNAEARYYFRAIYFLAIKELGINIEEKGYDDGYPDKDGEGDGWKNK